MSHVLCIPSRIRFPTINGIEAEQLAVRKCVGPSGDDVRIPSRICGASNYGLVGWFHDCDILLQQGPRLTGGFAGPLFASAAPIT